jgi:hypothetical protein
MYKKPLYIQNSQENTNLFPSEGPRKFTQIWDFWFEKKPSGNPG